MSSKDKEAKEQPYVYQPYPCFRYKDGVSRFCKDEAEEKALGPGWSDSPAGNSPKKADEPKKEPKKKAPKKASKKSSEKEDK